MSRSTRDLPLAVAALFIAFVIWLIAKQGDISTSWVNAVVKVENAPENVDVRVKKGREGLALNVQFPKEQRGRIAEKHFLVLVDAARVFSEDPERWPSPEAIKNYNYPIGPDDVGMVGLDRREVHVIEIDPDFVELEAELRSRQVDVVTSTTGQPSDRYELTGPLNPQPEKVYVTGSKEALERLRQMGDKIELAPIDLSLITEPDQIERPLILPAGIRLVNERDRTVQVAVGVSERLIPRTLYAVPIRLTPVKGNLEIQTDPQTAEIEIKGPTSALNRIKAKDIVFSPQRALVEEPGSSQQVGLRAELSHQVARDLARQIEILSVRPSSITIKFVPREAQNDILDVP